jgi:REP element-mobilizing transposase RayT
MAHSYVEVYLHIVFSTKVRTPWITPDIEHRLYPYMAGIAAKKKVPTFQINGTTDHVHLLQKLHPSVSIAKLVGDMKALSTAFVKKLGVSDFSWQQGYGAFSCSVTHVDRVKRYIRRQKEHHHALSFDEEMAHYAEVWGFRWIGEG